MSMTRVTLASCDSGLMSVILSAKMSMSSSSSNSESLTTSDLRITRFSATSNLRTVAAQTERSVRHNPHPNKQNYNLIRTRGGVFLDPPLYQELLGIFGHIMARWKALGKWRKMLSSAYFCLQYFQHGGHETGSSYNYASVRDRNAILASN